MLRALPLLFLPRPLPPLEEQDQPGEKPEDRDEYEERKPDAVEDPPDERPPERAPAQAPCFIWNDGAAALPGSIVHRSLPVGSWRTQKTSRLRRAPCESSRRCGRFAASR